MSQTESIHRRRNPLSGDYVLVSPHRNNRPWQGAVEKASAQALPAHDATCPLCANNTRANGEHNPDYKKTFVFTNDFAAINRSKASGIEDSEDDLLHAEAVNGSCKVICFAPQHNLSLPELELEAVEAVVATWVDEYRTMSEEFNWVQIFENKGAVMGCSQPHSHGQIWAHDFVPSYASSEDSNQLDYFQKHARPMLLDYLDRELAAKERIVVENEHWVALVPYWAAWPFETLLLPKHHLPRMSDLSIVQQKSLAEALKELTTRYDNIFECSFPYSMGWHGAPSRLKSADHWQLHAHFYPPLLRSASVKKHMVGYEMMAESQRDLSAESAAKILQNISTTHYKKQK